MPTLQILIRIFVLPLGSCALAGGAHLGECAYQNAERHAADLS